MSRTREALLGRDREVELFEHLLGDVWNGVAGFAVVSGQAGIGKTRLLDELAELSIRRGCLALSGRAAEFQEAFPFGLFVDALDAYLGSLDRATLDRLAVDRLGALAAVFPSLQVLVAAIPYPASAAERFRVHQAVCELLERLAARRPLVLILDDVHWADSASLELISYLLRHPPQAEVLLAMALRPGQGDTNVVKTLAGIRRTSVVHSIELGPLPLEVVKTLIGNTGVDVDQVQEQSGGNPFYALQLARFRTAGVNAGSDALEGLPSGIAEAIEAELAALSVDSRAMAEAAAVVGDPFDIDLAMAISGQSEFEVLQRIDDLVSKELVRGTDAPRRLQFRHPVVRNAIYSACPLSARMRYHQRAVEALAARGASPTQLAHHVEQSAHHGDVEAIELLRQAGEQASTHAPTIAVRWFTAALRLVPGEAHGKQRIELLTLLSASLAVLGRFGEALAALEECIALHPPTEELPVPLVVACAELEMLLGHYDDSTTRLKRAYEGLADQQSPASTSVMISLSWALIQLADYSGSLDWGRRAGTAAEASEDPALQAAALATQTMSAALAGEVKLARELHDRAMRLIDSLSDRELESRRDVLNNLTAAEIYLDLYFDASRHGERCLYLARATGQTQLLPVLAPILGTAWWMMGEMAKSAELLDDAIESARLAENPPTLAWSLFNRAVSALMAGDTEAALELSDESVEIARGFDAGLISSYAGATKAQVLLEVGDPKAALVLLLESAGGEGLPLMAGSWRPTYFEILTRCYLAVGDIDHAQTAAARARQQADELGMSLPSLMADRAEAAVALAEGRPEDAEVLASSAIRRSEEIGARVHTATSRALAGRALAAAGQRDKALSQLETAAGEFDALGAFRYRDQVDFQLRQLGGTIHRRSRPGQTDGRGVETLTGRELEVAELVLDRRTNREIAEMLFLSTKTVESHMRNIFNKLGVSSRVEVARTLSQARV